MNRRRILLLAAAGSLLASFAAVDGVSARSTLQFIKDPNCGCCGDHATYLRAHGYTVDVTESEDLTGKRAELGVPEALVGCHIILAEGYVIEGHVPAAAIDKLLAERPAIRGISVPGMPEGSPGMSGEKTEPLVVLTIQDGMPRVYFTE